MGNKPETHSSDTQGEILYQGTHMQFVFTRCTCVNMCRIRIYTYFLVHTSLYDIVNVHTGVQCMYGHSPHLFLQVQL